MQLNMNNSGSTVETQRVKSHVLWTSTTIISSSKQKPRYLRLSAAHVELVESYKVQRLLVTAEYTAGAVHAHHYANLRFPLDPAWEDGASIAILCKWMSTRKADAQGSFHLRFDPVKETT